LTRHEIAKATGVRKLAIPALCITLAWRVRLAEVVHREAHVKTCPDCNGDGVIEKGTDDEQQCPTCGGSGFVPDDNDDNEEIIRTVDAKGMSAKGQWRTHAI